MLAKIPGGPPGTKGISLFIVPKFLVDADGSVGERNDVVLAGLNHKMGQRGITNTVLNFGEGKFTPGGKPGAVGYLVGEPHRGLAYMFHMMNEARLGVGMGAVSLGYTGYLKSLEYARERPQGRPVLAKDPSAPQVPIIEHADVKRMLLAQKAYVEGGMALLLYCARLVDLQHSAESDEERDAAGLLLDILTPVGKSWPSQWCLEANNLAIQVHGGYGYTREYDVEQHYRDNRLNPIHEGTHGIQSLDLLGRKVTQRGGASLAALGDAVGRDGRDGHRGGRRDGRARRRSSTSTWQRLVARDRRDVRLGRRRGRAGQQRDLPRSLRAHRRRVDLAGASARRRRPRPATSTTASARPRATSSATNCRRRRRNWICWKVWTAPHSKCATGGFDPALKREAVRAYAYDT